MEIRNIDLSDFLPNYQGHEATFRNRNSHSSFSEGVKTKQTTNQNTSVRLVTGLLLWVEIRTIVKKFIYFFKQGRAGLL